MKFHIEFQKSNKREGHPAKDVINYCTKNERYTLYEYLLNTFLANHCNFAEDRIDAILFCLHEKIKKDEKFFITAQLESLKAQFARIKSSKKQKYNRQEKKEVKDKTKLQAFKYIVDKDEYITTIPASTDPATKSKLVANWLEKRQAEIKAANAKDCMSTD